MITRRTALAIGLGSLAGCISPRQPGERLLYADDFRSGLGAWTVEAEQPGRIVAADGWLDVDVPAGTSLWYRQPLAAPVAIEFFVTAVAEGGPNDEVSDINCFWMASDGEAPDGEPVLKPRTGAFAEYDTLRTYYAGIGGNRNSSTRFRRYVGVPGNRPLLPEHDLSRPADLNEPNREYHLRLVAAGPRVELLRDGIRLFSFRDAAPYERGYFAFRTTKSHLRFRDFKVFRLPT